MSVTVPLQFIPALRVQSLRASIIGRNLAMWTNAPNAASAKLISEGLVAMHEALVPRTAWLRLTPSIAEQPLPGVRLLQGVAVS